MATATVTNTLVDATTVEAADHNTNFTDLVTFLNASVVHVDGSKAMAAALAFGGFKATGLAAGTATGDAARFDEVDAIDTRVTTLEARPANVEVYNTLAQSVNDSSNTAKVNNAETRDDWTGHDNATNNDRISADTEGLYLISTFVVWEADEVTGYRQITAQKNSTGSLGVDRSNAVTGDSTVCNLSLVVYLEAGDYVNFVVYQDNDANNAVEIAANSWCSLTRLT